MNGRVTRVGNLLYRRLAVGTVLVTLGIRRLPTFDAERGQGSGAPFAR